MPTDGKVSPQGILEKFEFYFLGLTFTLLGASIQTATFEAAIPWSIYSELAGWLGLLISGLAGLSKVEWISALLLVKNRRDNLSELNSQLNLLLAQGHRTALNSGTGKTQTIDELLESVGKNIQSYSEQLSGLSRWHGVKQHIQKWAFVIGLVLVAAARAYAALHAIASS